ncbi:MAG: hypothetical protein KDD33_01490 [Bdellovibrionales bacterium]|nr:hypothetical protein [Bdellovibrionales bacterium]
MKNQAGQMTVEAILIVTLLFSGVMLARNLIQEKRLLAKLVEEPWQYLSGMIENGIWAPPEEGRPFHPNLVTRHGSPQGDPP